MDVYLRAEFGATDFDCVRQSRDLLLLLLLLLWLTATMRVGRSSLARCELQSASLSLSESFSNFAGRLCESRKLAP